MRMMATLLVVMLAGCVEMVEPTVADPAPTEAASVSEAGTFASNEGSANATASESNDDSDDVNVSPGKLYSTGDDFHQVRCWYIKGGREWGMSCLPYSQIANPRQ